MKLKIAVILALLIAGAGAVFVSLRGLPAAGAAQTTYLTATAAVGDVTDEVAATGTIGPSATYALAFGADPQPAGDSSAASGSATWRVTKVAVVPGQPVKRGDVLATADTADLRDQLEQAKASLSSARIQETIARENLDAADTTDATRQAKIAWNGAHGQRLQAQASVDDLARQIRLATLTSPIDGIVTTVNAVAGYDVSGTAIEVASGQFEVTADVVESDVSSMSVGQAATVTVSAIDAVIQGTVTAIAPGAASSSGSGSVVSYPVTVRLTGAPAALRAGMSADISIVTASATDVLTIPSEALRGTAGSYRVQVLAADGSVATREVTVGLVTSSLAEVKSGLAVGDVVVTGTSAARQSTTTTGGGLGGGGVITGPGRDFQRP